MHAACVYGKNKIDMMTMDGQNIIAVEMNDK